MGIQGNGWQETIDDNGVKWARGAGQDDWFVVSGPND